MCILGIDPGKCGIGLCADNGSTIMNIHLNELPPTTGNNDICEFCRSEVVSYSAEGGCPICGAPNCCFKCCLESLKEMHNA